MHRRVIPGRVDVVAVDFLLERDVLLLDEDAQPDRQRGIEVGLGANTGDHEVAHAGRLSSVRTRPRDTSACLEATALPVPQADERRKLATSRAPAVREGTAVMDSKLLQVEQLEGGVALVRMNRPDKLNALNPALIAALSAYFGALRAGEYDVRAVVLTGAGRAFCAGGDFAPRDPDALPPAWHRAHAELESIRFMRDADVPIVGALNGFAIGGGFSLALACDVRIAADDVVFQVAQMKRGIIPEYGLSYFLQESLGRQRALELIFSARRVDAAEALALGLVLDVVPRADLEARAVGLAQSFAAGAPLGNAAAKRLVYSIEDSDLTRVQELGNAYIAQLRVTEDGAEGVRSFIERREPEFRGR